jgi:Zn-dependent protease with chaperone function
MFANFIYLIVALLIISLYQAPEELPLSAAKTFIGFAALAVLHAIYVRSRFRRLLNRMAGQSPARLDHYFTQLTTRCSILSLMLLTIDIWWLHLPAYLRFISWLEVIPTLNSLLFLVLFLSYLIVIWACSYEAHKAIYRTDISRGNYVYSNIAFSVPILIPWILLFGIIDVIQLLPFDTLRRILDSRIGQIAYFLIFLVVAALFTPLLIQRLWRCSPMEDGPDRHRIEALCRRAGVRYADIVYWPIFGGRMITAAVMGLVGRFRYILVTNALLKLLHPEEVDQVIAHEIGHVKHKHLLLYLLFFTGFILISYAAYPVSTYLLFFKGPILQAIKFFGLNPFSLHYTFEAVFVIIAIVIYFRFIFGYFMRNFERQADVFVFELFPTAQPLISTFDKIVASSGQPADKPNWHHFSIKQRIDFLWRCERFPEWITRHHRKVTKSIIAFVAILIGVAAAVFQLNRMVNETGGRHINVADLESYLDQKVHKTEADSALYWIIGDIYLERGETERAVPAYRSAIALDPDNPDTLNNLAWLLATSDNPDLRNPRQALILARKAIALKKAPHIWDTLAEALYVNGHVAEAIGAENQALQLNPDNRKIYEKQLLKFKNAEDSRNSVPVQKWTGSD